MSLVQVTLQQLIRSRLVIVIAHYLLLQPDSLSYSYLANSYACVVTRIYDSKLHSRQQLQLVVI